MAGRDEHDVLQPHEQPSAVCQGEILATTDISPGTTITCFGSCSLGNELNTLGFTNEFSDLFEIQSICVRVFKNNSQFEYCLFSQARCIFPTFIYVNEYIDGWGHMREKSLVNLAHIFVSPTHICAVKSECHCHVT